MSNIFTGGSGSQSLLIGTNFTKKYDSLAEEFLRELKEGSNPAVAYFISANGEYDTYETACGVDAYHVIANTVFSINPLDMINKDASSWGKVITEKSEFLVNLVKCLKGDCTPFETAAIHRTCNFLYEDYITETDRQRDNGAEIHINTDMSPTLMDFYNKLIDEGTPEGNKLSLVFEPYCAGNYSFFAYKTNIGSLNTKAPEGNVLIIDLKDIPEDAKTFAILCVLEYIRNTDNAAGKALVHIPFDYEYFKTAAEVEALNSVCGKLTRRGDWVALTAAEVHKRFEAPENLAVIRNLDSIAAFSASYKDMSKIRDLRLMEELTTGDFIIHLKTNEYQSL